MEDEVEDPNHMLVEAKQIPNKYRGTFGGVCLQKFYNHLPQMCNAYTLLGYYCSPVEEVMQHVANSLVKQNSREREIINSLVLKLLGEKMDTMALQESRDATNLATFWEEQRLFINRKPPFHHGRIWADERRMTHPHHWHRDNSLHQTKVFGRICCLNQGAPTGMTSAERNWGDVKEIWKGKRSRLSSSQVAKLTTIQGAHHVEKCKKKGGDQVSSLSFPLLCCTSDCLLTSVVLHVCRRNGETSSMMTRTSTRLD